MDELIAALLHEVISCVGQAIIEQSRSQVLAEPTSSRQPAAGR